MVRSYNRECIFAAGGIKYRSRIHGSQATFSIFFFDRSLGLFCEPPRNSPTSVLFRDRGNHRHVALVLGLGSIAPQVPVDAILQCVFVEFTGTRELR